MHPQAQQIVDQVEGGVARSIDELVRETLEMELEDLDNEVTDDIDEAIFTCENCGWTMPREEESEDEEGTCEECVEDQEE